MRDKDAEESNAPGAAEPGPVSDGAFGSLVRHASDIIMVLGTDGAFRYMSPASERWLGYEPAELVGENAFERLHPDDYELAAAAFADLLRGAGSNPPIELRMRHKDGSWRFLEMMGTNLLDDPGVRGVVVNVRDVTERKQAEEKLRETEARYRTLVEQMPAIVYIQELRPEADDAYPVSYMGPRAEEMLGYPPRAFVEDPGLWDRIIHPNDRERVLSEDRRTDEAGESFSAEYRMIARDGRTVWVRDEAVLIRDEEGHPLYWQGFMSDTTERKRAGEALKESEQRFRALVQNSSDVVTVVAADGTIRYQSPAVGRVLGYRTEELVGENAFDYIHPDDRERVLERFSEGSKSPGTTFTPVEYRFRHADGSWRHLEGIGNNLLDDPAIGGVVINSRDVTERKALERELAHQALHDPLTGLANRRLFEDRLVHALARAGRRDGLVAILYLDLDDFKVVNDSWGHGAGDRLLTEVARRLASCLREADTAARLGGDEFAVLLEDAADEGVAARTAARILKVLEAPFALEGREVRVSVSIGISSGGAGEAAGELLRKADQAMYRAKEAGKNRHAAFGPKTG